MATATFTTVVDRGIGDPLTEAIWDDQIKDNVNQLAGAHRNLLTNGGFEVWQRGAGAFTTSNTYTSDRWHISIGASSTLSITREASIIDASGRYAFACAHTRVADSHIRQYVEDYVSLRGRTVSASVRVRQSVANAVSFHIEDQVSAATSSTSATTGSYVTLTATHTVDAAATEYSIHIILGATGTFYLDNAMLVIGPAPAPYQPLHPQEELSRCQRYYEVHGGVNPSLGVNGYGGAGTTTGQYVGFHTQKGGTPTLTKNGTWNVTNCGQPTVANGDDNGYTLNAVVTALGAYSIYCNSTDDTVTSEFNP